MITIFVSWFFGVCWICGRSLHISREGGSGPPLATSNNSNAPHGSQHTFPLTAPIANGTAQKLVRDNGSPKKASAGPSPGEGHAGNVSVPALSFYNGTLETAGDSPHHHHKGHSSHHHDTQKTLEAAGHGPHRHNHGHSGHHVDTEAMTQHKNAAWGSAEQHGQSKKSATHHVAKANTKGKAGRLKAEWAEYEKRVAHYKACQAERDFNISKHIQTRKCKRPEKPVEEEEEERQRKSLPLVTTDEFKTYTFEDFVHDFKRGYQKNTAWWKSRKQTFEQNREAVMKFRELVQPKSWNAGITMFMDYGAEEYTQLLGLKVDRSSKASPPGGAPAQAQGLAQFAYEKVPAEISLVDPDVPLSGFVRSQGACGSCWAAAATSTIEGAMLKDATLRRQVAGRAKVLESSIETLSTEAVVSCTKNLRHCGGKGGCSGATVELAFDMVMANGLPLAAEWPYTSGKTSNQENCDKSHFHVPVLVTMSSYKVLPKNDLASLLTALVQRGHPIAVSVDATNWYYYAGGIYSDMDIGQGDFTLNHAVTLVGFKKPSDDNVSSDLVDSAGSGEFPDSTGSDEFLVQRGRRQLMDTNPASQGYYLVKNSWGPWFGESGFIRVEMKKNESDHCGWDMDTHKGVACEGDPKKDWVCGTCGILYDSVYPEGVKSIQPNITDYPKIPGLAKGGKQTETGLSRGANWRP